MTACRDTLRSLSLFTREDIAPGQGLLAAPWVLQVRQRPTPIWTDPMTASLMAVLTRHGSHLQRVSLSTACLSLSEAWPVVAVALGRLPRRSASRWQLEELDAPFDSDLERFELIVKRRSSRRAVKAPNQKSQEIGLQLTALTPSSYRCPSQFLVEASRHAGVEEG
ncbi:hypothetical protein PAPYR_8943 [Paratrimastix pyriformis]|uniref:Uncharacterized protein n=1 Tax=Paratrimastix pyriformis TaxID=342808 RepID=A0ABQ8U9I9_9EUKA|nr:hypothetical protein PAPYR_8943 [Paratrimastix pyriformis]